MIPDPSLKALPADLSTTGYTLFFLKALCLLSGLAMHLAPLWTMREIQGARSTLSFHIAPYAGPLLNHLVNLWYAILRSDNPLIIHRVIGISMQAYYISIFLKFMPATKEKETFKWLNWVWLVLVAIFAELYIFLPLIGWWSFQYPHVAFFAFVTGVGLAASPLATVGEVLRTKDASSLPTGLCAMVTLQCFSWMVYGYVRDDLSTFANNLIGVALGSFQLVLIGLYGKKTTSNSGVTATNAILGGIGKETNNGFGSVLSGVSISSSRGEGNGIGGVVGESTGSGSGNGPIHRALSP
jgi:hypothetical protein